MKLDPESVEELVLDLVGEEVIPLVRLLIGKANYSEFKLADKLGINVNHVRNLLYKLGAHNLVSSIRKKDKKKGWYIYYWSLDNREVGDSVIGMKKRHLVELWNELGREKNSSFFVCANKCLRVDLESAMEFEFKCQECGQLLVQDDSVKKIEEIKKKIEKIDEELKGYEEKKVKALARKTKRNIKKVKKKVVKKKVVKKKPVKKRNIKKVKKSVKKKVKKKVVKKKVKKKR